MKVLCTCLPGSGHFLPMLSTAQAVAAAGHEVRFATAAEFLPSIEKKGFATFAAGITLEQQLDEANRRYPEAKLPPGKERFEVFVPRMLAGVAAPPRADDLVPIVGDWRPDVLIHDETEFAGPVVATKFRVPYADQSVGIMRPLSMARLAGRTLAPVVERLGVDPDDIGDFGGMFAYLYLDVCPPSLQTAEIAQVDVAHRAHNLSVAGAGEQAPDWVADLARQPTIYVSLGTIFNRDKGIFGAILEGLRDQPLNVIVTVGSNNDPADLGPQPENVRVERFIPQAVLLPHCDAVVNQGGTAILDILGHGLPLLVLPQSANQFHNAEACQRAGVGRVLQPDQVTPAAVRAEMAELLSNPTYRQRAEQIRQEFEVMPGPAHGARMVEDLAERRAPLRPARPGS